MKKVEFLNFTMPGSKKWSRWKLPREDIERRGGTPVEATLEVRDLPETEEERRDAHRRPSFGRRPGP